MGIGCGDHLRDERLRVVGWVGGNNIWVVGVVGGRTTFDNFTNPNIYEALRNGHPLLF